MTKKEFLKRVHLLRLYFETYNYYDCHTCIGVHIYISPNTRIEYEKFIKNFLYGQAIKYEYSKEKSGYPMILRCMLTEAFFEECLRTGKYKEF